MKDSIIHLNSDLKSILVAINHDPAGIAFIINDRNELKGILTDGDFRRLLLKGRKLTDPLVPSDLSDFVFAKEGESLQQLMKKTSKKVRIIPVVNKKNEPIDYFRYEHKTHFTPIAAPNLSGNELNYVTDAILSTWISSTGSYINRFEESFADYCGVNHGVAVSNGTVALHLALVALGIGAGDEVIIPDLTFAATANAVLLSGATPVIVDVELESWCIDSTEIKKAITSRTKAVIPVHVYGQPCDINEIMHIANDNNLFVIEDAAEAHGAEYKGKKVGSFGHISCFSFFANKIITTGEGGMCLTNDDALNEKMRKLRDHGMNKEKKYWHDEVGFNYRMTNIQAAVGCAQLEQIDEILENRNQLEKSYKKVLSDSIDWQPNLEGRKKVVWLVAGLSKKDRDSVIKKFKDNSIDMRPFFYPLSEMPIFSKYKFGHQKNSYELSRKGINLPTIDQVDLQKIKSIFETIN